MGFNPVYQPPNPDSIDTTVDTCPWHTHPWRGPAIFCPCLQKKPSSGVEVVIIVTFAPSPGALAPAALEVTRMWFLPAVLSLLLLLQALPCWLQAPSPTKLRLVGPGSRPEKGRLEVLHQGQWGTVCDDDFALQEAIVACRQLGFETALTWAHSANYGQGEGECPVIPSRMTRR